MVKLWVHILIKANWTNYYWHGQEYPRGSFITSISNLSKQTKLSEWFVKEGLKRLKNSKQIHTQTTKRFTVIYIDNYDTFQDSEEKTNQQTTDKPRINHEQNADKTTTVKELKNLRSKEKDINTSSFDDCENIQNNNNDELIKMLNRLKEG